MITKYLWLQCISRKSRSFFRSWLQSYSRISQFYICVFFDCRHWFMPLIVGPRNIMLYNFSLHSFTICLVHTSWWEYLQRIFYRRPEILVLIKLNIISPRYFWFHPVSPRFSPRWVDPHMSYTIYIMYIIYVICDTFSLKNDLPWIRLNEAWTAPSAIIFNHCNPINRQPE